MRQGNQPPIAPVPHLLRKNRNGGDVKSFDNGKREKSKFRAMPRESSLWLSLLLKVDERGQLVIGYHSVSLPVEGVKENEEGECRFSFELAGRWNRNGN